MTDVLTLDQALSPKITGRMTCRRVLTYFPWLLIGVSPASLSPQHAYPLIRHAKKCQSCGYWLKTVFGFDGVEDFEKFFNWSRSHKQ